MMVTAHDYIFINFDSFSVLYFKSSIPASQGPTHFPKDKIIDYIKRSKAKKYHIIFSINIYNTRFFITLHIIKNPIWRKNWSFAVSLKKNLLDRITAKWLIFKAFRNSHLLKFNWFQKHTSIAWGLIFRFFMLMSIFWG